MPDREGQGSHAVQPDLSWIVLRPAETLMELPLAMRWEVTRRHPYYLRFWELAHRFYQSPSPHPQQREPERAAALLLQAIGVAADPPPPGADWACLDGGQLSRGWQLGAVAPVTLRGFIATLLTTLPTDLRVEVAQLLLAASAPASDDHARREATFAGLAALSALRHPAFDAFPAVPVVSINLQAPQRIIGQAIEDLVRQWKRDRAIPERRRRDDKLGDYLAVWDLREGWAGDHYDGTKELTLRAVAIQLGIPLPTASNRYQSAFQLIVGHAYAPELWVRIFGPLKWNRWLAAGPEGRASQRPWRTRQRRPVLERTLAAVTQNPEEAGLLSNIGVEAEEFAQIDLVLDIQTLFRQGHGNAAILAELELTPEFAPLIDYLRERAADPA